jgi:hypothetical protein
VSAPFVRGRTAGVSHRQSGAAELDQRRDDARTQTLAAFGLWAGHCRACPSQAAGNAA